MSNEKIGRHKGALETLIHEKKELSRLLQIVNSQIQRNMQGLEQEGIDSEQYIQELQDGQEKQQQKQRQRQQQNKKQQKTRRQNKNRNSSNRQSSNSRNSSKSQEQQNNNTEASEGPKRDFNPL